MNDVAQAARRLSRAENVGSHWDECWEAHTHCCLLRCAQVIESLEASMKSLREELACANSGTD